MTLPPTTATTPASSGPSPQRPRPRRTRRRALFGVLAGVLVLVLAGATALLLGNRGGGETPVSPPSSAPVVTQEPVDTGALAAVPFGVFRDNSAEETAAYEAWIGRQVDVAVVFGSRDTWQDIRNSDWLLDGWRDAPQRLAIGVPLLPTEDDSATVEEGATGAYDDVYVEFAQRLVAEGQADAILRLGWEFNLEGSRWSTEDAEAWKAYYRSVVEAMRSVPGQQFEFDWNVNNGGGGIGDPVDYYPGDDVVDYVGVDAYDVAGAEGTYPVPDGCTDECALERHQAAWDGAIYGGERGLQFWSGFAKEHGKKLSLPEWGLWDRVDGTGGGDDPYYIEQMARFIADPDNGVAYQAYFEVDNTELGPHRLMTGFPESSQLFRDLFGGSQG
ncbi:glycosyl hydrolase [Quadrisphaera sp. INWT6]|uniref:glycosyl hydrolase n=1 Tax=Quadrisphaera sp. INWT6 TaxID=2596917 RepID=UPI0018924C8B|nr:glycosyl hydrolase [Quadrisphaera sp. INWT6]MBF5080391.1 hypothetical protein [Quadrisphaera sp. INWT6]